MSICLPAGLNLAFPCLLLSNMYFRGVVRLAYPKSNILPDVVSRPVTATPDWPNQWLPRQGPSDRRQKQRIIARFDKTRQLKQAILDVVLFSQGS